MYMIRSNICKCLSFDPNYWILLTSYLVPGSVMNSTTKMIKILGIFLWGLIKKIPRGYQYGVIKFLFIGFKIKNRPQYVTQIAATLGWAKEKVCSYCGTYKKSLLYWTFCLSSWNKEAISIWNWKLYYLAMVH